MYILVVGKGSQHSESQETLSHPVALASTAMPWKVLHSHVDEPWERGAWAAALERGDGHFH